MHPIIECASDLRAVLKDVSSVEPAFMSVDEKQAALVALTEVRSQLDAVTARLLAASDDVGEAHGRARSGPGKMNSQKIKRPAPLPGQA